MKHRTLGKSGLIVSEVALGTMQFGAMTNRGNLGQEATTRMVRFAVDRGINLIVWQTCTVSRRSRCSWEMH